VKLNYYTYTTTFKDTGAISGACIKDILDNYCKYQKNKHILEKVVEKSSKKLYLAKAVSYSEVYYLMVPASLNNYRSLNKSSGEIRDLKEILDEGDSLEKVTYIYIDDKRPIIGISASLGGATDDDLQYYLNEVLNGVHEEEEDKYKFKLSSLQNELKKTNVGKLKLISQANVLLNNENSLGGMFKGLLTGGTSDNNIQIGLTFKRVGNKKGIESAITPLLGLIAEDINSKEFAEIHLRAKQNSLSENIKDYFLDHSMILYDVLNPYLVASIETQVQDRPFSNESLNTAYSGYLKEYSENLTKKTSCSNWKALSKKATYEASTAK
jgi:hypothetical protein